MLDVDLREKSVSASRHSFRYGASLLSTARHNGTGTLKDAVFRGLDEQFGNTLAVALPLPLLHFSIDLSLGVRIFEALPFVMKFLSAPHANDQLYEAS